MKCERENLHKSATWYCELKFKLKWCNIMEYEGCTHNKPITTCVSTVLIQIKCVKNAKYLFNFPIFIRWKWWTLVFVWQSLVSWQSTERSHCSFDIHFLTLFNCQLQFIHFHPDHVPIIYHCHHHCLGEAHLTSWLDHSWDTTESWDSTGAAVRPKCCGTVVMLVMV